MPSWGVVGKLINERIAKTGGSGIEANGDHVIDNVRREFLSQINDITGRRTVLYATRWTVTGTPYAVPPDVLSIVYEDTHGFMETLHGAESGELNIVLHSPGGSPTAAAAIVNYIREKFQDVTVFVPHMAMSAATMIACASNRIVMGRHSSIGPVDPQITLATTLGIRMVAAQAIVDQFELAKKECADPAKLAAWAPMLTQYGPDLLVACKNAQDLSRQLVTEWLAKWMFAADGNASQKAAEIAKWLGSHQEFKDHGRPISRDEAGAKGLKVDALENDQRLQDAVLSTFHAAAHTFAATACAKIIENDKGRAFLKLVAGPQAA